MTKKEQIIQEALGINLIPIMREDVNNKKYVKRRLSIVGELYCVNLDAYKKALYVFINKWNNWHIRVSKGIGNYGYLYYKTTKITTRYCLSHKKLYRLLWYDLIDYLFIIRCD